MGRIYENVSELVGRTPLVRLNRLTEGLGAQVVVKLEFYNPANSVKDRIGVAIIDAAEQSGELKPGGTIVEATSGNTGIALAMIGAARGYKVILTMPETMSTERRVMLRAYGAEIVLTPGSEGMAGAVAKAKQLIAETENAVVGQSVRQPGQPGDPREDDRRGGLGRHRREGRRLRGGHRHRRHHHRRRASPQVAQAKCADRRSRAQGFPAADRRARPGPHKIQGIGANFIPEVLDRDIYDEIIDVGVRRLHQGRAGSSAPTRASSAASPPVRSSGPRWNLAKRPENAGKLIVAIVCDYGERYISTALFDDIRD